MWEQVIRKITESTRKVCGSLRVGKTSECVVDGEVKAAVRRKEAAWKVEICLRQSLQFRGYKGENLFIFFLS